MVQLELESCFGSISEFEFELEAPGHGILGTGSLGNVRLALHKGTNKVYAIKTLNTNKLTTESQTQLIRREILIHSQLDHPHIVKLWGTLCQSGKIFMVMDYADNESLLQYQAQRSTLQEPESFKYFYQMTKAVEHLHSCDILHRDIKPQNLLLDENFNIKLCDFGWSATEIRAQRNTVCGTGQYMAPQMVNGLSYDHKVDIWAMGIVLFKMIHGTTPFSGSTLEEVRRNMMQPIKYNKGINPALRALLDKLLAVDPVKRPEAKEVLRHEWVSAMKERINNDLKKQSNLSPKLVNQKISQPNTITQHKKTQSSGNLKRESNNSSSNFNSSLMPNAYASTRKMNQKVDPNPKPRIVKEPKTLAENSKSRDDVGALKLDKDSVFGKYPQYSKVLSKIKSSQDFRLKDIMRYAKRASRRKSQDVMGSQGTKIQGTRTTTEASQKKKHSNKRTYDDLSSILKKANSADFFARKQKLD